MNRSKLIRTLAVASSAMVVTALGGRLTGDSPEHLSVRLPRR